MLNIEKYKEEILEKYNEGLKNSGGDRYSTILAKAIFDVFCSDKCRKEMENVAEWALREYEEPILTDEEKIIIKDIVKVFEPFGKELSYISKNSLGCDSSRCYLYFKYEDDSSGTPTINSGELFVGMELDKSYTLEELGL